MTMTKYEEIQSILKEHISTAPNKIIKFIRWLCYFISFPWLWFFYNIRDWRNILIFIPILLIMSSEIWIPGLLGIIYKNNIFVCLSMYFLMSFWITPGSPFMVFSIVATIGVKTLWNKITKKRTS